MPIMHKNVILMAVPACWPSVPAVIYVRPLVVAVFSWLPAAAVVVVVTLAVSEAPVINRTKQ